MRAFVDFWNDWVLGRLDFNLLWKYLDVLPDSIVESFSLAEKVATVESFNGERVEYIQLMDELGRGLAPTISECRPFYPCPADYVRLCNFLIAFHSFLLSVLRERYMETFPPDKDFALSLLRGVTSRGTSLLSNFECSADYLQKIINNFLLDGYVLRVFPRGLVAAYAGSLGYLLHSGGDVRVFDSASVEVYKLIVDERRHINKYDPSSVVRSALWWEGINGTDPRAVKWIMDLNRAFETASMKVEPFVLKKLSNK